MSPVIMQTATPLDNSVAMACLQAHAVSWTGRRRQVLGLLDPGSRLICNCHDANDGLLVQAWALRQHQHAEAILRVLLRLLVAPKPVSLQTRLARLAEDASSRN